jgi:hypothetical protein
MAFQIKRYRSDGMTIGLCQQGQRRPAGVTADRTALFERGKPGMAQKYTPCSGSASPIRCREFAHTAGLVNVQTGQMFSL